MFEIFGVAVGGGGFDAIAVPMPVGAVLGDKGLAGFELVEQGFALGVIFDDADLGEGEFEGFWGFHVWEQGGAAFG